MDRTIALIRQLEARTDIPVEYVDERLSSVQTERMLRESGAEPSRDRSRIDSAAAAVILHAYLDGRRAGWG